MEANKEEMLVKEVAVDESVKKAPRKGRGKAEIKVPKLDYIIIFNAASNRFEASVSGSNDYKNLIASGLTALSALERLGKKVIKPQVMI